LSTKARLIELGASLGKVEIIPEGESSPIAENDTIENRALNRRGELKIIDKK